MHGRYGNIFVWWCHRGVHGCMKCIRGVFWLEKALKPWKDTTWSVPKCVLKCFLVFSVQYVLTVHVNNIPPLMGETMFKETQVLGSKSSLRGKSPLPSKLPLWFIMKTLPGWLLEHNSLLILELIYMMFAPWNPDNMCYEMWEPVFIYTAKARLVYRSTVLGAVVKTKRYDRTTDHYPLVV